MHQILPSDKTRFTRSHLALLAIAFVLGGLAAINAGMSIFFATSELNCADQMHSLCPFILKLGGPQAAVIWTAAAAIVLSLSALTVFVKARVRHTPVTVIRSN